jgi:FtsH-binding integral membrane protein
MYPDPRSYQVPGYAAYGAAVPATLMTRVYQWMALGLGVTGATAMVMASLPDLELAIVGSPLIWVLLLATVGMAIALQGYAARMSAAVAFVVFFAYSALMGVSLAPIFWRYTAGSIGMTFIVSGGMFAATSLYGYVTRKDLSGWSTFLMMGLFGLIIASAVNAIFFGFGSPLLYWLTTYVGVIVFTGLTAFDTQRIRRAAIAAGPNAAPQMAIQGATMLYLDFVNLFVYLLRIFGRERD